MHIPILRFVSAVALVVAIWYVGYAAGRGEDSWMRALAWFGGIMAFTVYSQFTIDEGKRRERQPASPPNQDQSDR